MRSINVRPLAYEWNDLMDLVRPAIHREQVRALLGSPTFANSHRWRYRYRETQVEICFTENDSVDAVVMILLEGNKYYGSHPTGHTDRPLGDLTLEDVLDGEGSIESIRYFESGRTREVFICERWGPTGAWNYYACGAFIVLSGVGDLAEVSFEWDRDLARLKSDPKDVRINWMASMSSFANDPPGFDWFI